MNTFCHNPFIGLDINPEGHIRPCCKFLESEMPKFHIKQGIETYKKSKWVKKLQDQFIDGKRPKGCERCWKEESAGIESKRQLDYIRHKKQFDSVDLKNPNYINISLAFGNLCNLACRICSPNQSSRWASERNKLENKKIIEKSIFDLPCLLSSKVIGISIDFKFVFIKIDVISI